MIFGRRAPSPASTDAALAEAMAKLDRVEELEKQIGDAARDVASDTATAEARTGLATSSEPIQVEVTEVRVLDDHK